MSHKPKHIKAIAGFRNMAADNLLTTSNAVYSGLNGNANIPAPPAPYDLPALLAANAALSAANAAAENGGKKEIAQRNHEHEVVAKLLNLLTKYVEAACKDDSTIFLSSGFKAASSTKTLPPTASDGVRSVATGPNSGQMSVKVVAVPEAGSHELRWSPVPAGAVPTAWTSQPVTNTRTAVIVSGLTPGTLYAFQARAVVNSAYTDWSDSVTAMAV